MPRTNHSVKFKFPPRDVVASDVSETEARRIAKATSQANKNRAVQVLAANGTVKALFLNGKDVS